MTGDGVLKRGEEMPDISRNEFAEPPKKVHPGQVIKSLTQAVETLHKAEKMNKQLQSQFAVGSPSWQMCESIDDKLHEVFTLLGE